MQVGQGARQGHAQFQRLTCRKPSRLAPDLVERFWNVLLRIDLPAGRDVIGQLHDVIEEARRVISSNMKDIQQRPSRTRNGGELLQTAKFSLVGLGIAKACTPDDFYRTVQARDAAREPHVPIAAVANLFQHYVVWNRQGIIG